ncbi:hypothetical protein HanOQP8_Chr06g0229581 [Helianthus annuus]|nr:hypothetical protein HanOQP8_Chr06g0229581 [Helianthus annuus]KAJ0916345.1 hypothetical protein HanPSC8_Chr06g0260561 [Helianthus annuus]
MFNFWVVLLQFLCIFFFELFLTTNCCSFGAVFRVVLLQFCAFLSSFELFLIANSCRFGAIFDSKLLQFFFAVLSSV